MKNILKLVAAISDSDWRCTPNNRNLIIGFVILVIQEIISYNSYITSSARGLQ